MIHHKKCWKSLILPIGFACSMVCQCTYADVVPLPLGKLISTEDVTCPSGAATGAVCKHTVVTGCKDANGNPLHDEGVVIAFAQGQLPPQQKPKGTIILHSGGSGHGFLNNGFADYYTSQGFNVVQQNPVGFNIVRQNPIEFQYHSTEPVRFNVLRQNSRRVSMFFDRTPAGF